MILVHCCRTLMWYIWLVFLPQERLQNIYHWGD